MSSPSLLIALVGTLALCPTCNPAQPDARLTQLVAAFAAADRGQFDPAQYPGLAGPPTAPVYPWVQLAQFKHDIDSVPDATAAAFLAAHASEPVGDAFRELWLPSASRRQDWPAFRAAWSPKIQSAMLRCAELHARQATGADDAQWVGDAQALWRGTGKPLPIECDSPMAVLAAKGGLPPSLRWERIDKAASEGNATVMRTAAQGLPAPDQAQAMAYAAFMETPDARALGWPRTERSRWMASQGLAKLAKANPSAAEAQLPTVAQALGFTEADRGRVLYPIALWSLASYASESARRLAAVPASAYDDKLHEWQVREALARSDWAAALSAIRAMPDKQRSDSRWTYFEGRLRELTGDRSGAQAAYRRAAREPQFHGFLAADRIQQPYALCPLNPIDDPAQRSAVAQDPAMVRAMTLYRVGRTAWAQREWNDALTRFDATRRRLAVEVAQDNGWFDRGVFGLGVNPDELRLYRLRFPLHHDQAIRREAARNGLDPAWIAAEIRAESVFNPQARSSANAMGLMQVLPGTGQTLARRNGLPWTGADSLYDPDTNITFGTAYLRQLLDSVGGQTYLAIAAYNAGPAPMARWRAQRPDMDPDFWIETISYKETRDYVARVLAFSTIYDWRLDGTALPLTERMRGRTNVAHKSFACPPPVSASQG